MNAFPNDIFISYRHLDNKPVSGEFGWIDDFTLKLKTQLGFKLGYDPVIWRDKKLGGADYFADVIMRELQQSKILISILSPGYISPRSEWCMRELEEFYGFAQEGIGLMVGEKSRCIRVVKSFLEREQYPIQLQEQLGYEFYKKDEESERPEDFSYLEGGDHYHRYLKKIDDLAYDLSKILKAFEQPQPPQLTDIEHTVFLAEVTSDGTEHRDSIRSELLSRGFRVLPDRDLPDTAAEYEQTVAEQLKQSRLSIHLIGDRYGSTLEGDEEHSFVHIQNNVAAKHCEGSPGFSRVIWIAPDRAPSGTRQLAFIELLQTDPQAQKGAELLERPFEELKNRIIEKLAPPKPTAARVLQFPEQEPVRIYLMFDKLDFKSAIEVRDYLFERNYEVLLAARDGEATQVIQYHKDNLLECDAALVYYGHGNEFWFHSKVADLRKVRAWGREKPLLKGVYLAGPETEHKVYLKIREAVQLKPPGYLELSAPALDEFIAYIEGARANDVQREIGGQR
jgi:hypothetical protein